MGGKLPVRLMSFPHIGYNFYTCAECGGLPEIKNIEFLEEEQKRIKCGLEARCEKCDAPIIQGKITLWIHREKFQKVQREGINLSERTEYQL